MNKLNVLVTILCLTIFINACQKDNIVDSVQLENQVQNTEIETRSYDEETCGIISDLCLRCMVRGEVEEVEVKFPDLARQKIEDARGIDNNYLEIEIDGEKYTIRPAAYFGGKTQEYLVSTPKGNYMTSNIKNDYVNSKALEVKLPNVLENIYKLDHERFINGKLSFDEVKRTFGRNIKLLDTKDEGYRISITDVDVSSGIGSIFYAPCSGVTMSALVLDYQEILGMNDPHTNAPQIIEDALYANTPAGFDPKLDCHNTQDVVESILSDPLIAGSPIADFSIKLNYLNALLGLDEDNYNALSPFTSQNIALVDEVYNGLTVSQNLGACDKEDCGLIGGYHDYIRATIGGLVLSSTDLESLLDTYSLLRCENPSLYSCLRTVQQGSESQTFEGCFSNAFNNYCLVEFDGNSNVVDANAPLIPFSCESFPLTQIGTYTYRTTVLGWAPSFAEWASLPMGMGVVKGKPIVLDLQSFDIEVTGVPGEAECEIQNLVAEAFNKANNKAMKFFGINFMYNMTGADGMMRIIMKADLETFLAERFPFGVLVNMPAIDESVGQPLINNIPGFEVVDCC